MGSALEASSQRIRYHLRRPIPGREEVLTRNARNTVKEIVPFLVSLMQSLLRKYRTVAPRNTVLVLSNMIEYHLSRELVWRDSDKAWLGLRPRIGC